MANIRLYLDGRRPRKDGTCLLKLSVSHQRQVRYVSLGIYLLPSCWDAGQGVVLRSHPAHARLNNAISRLRLRAEDALLSLLSSSKGLDLTSAIKAITSTLNPPENDSPHGLPAARLLIPVMERFADAKKDSTRLTYGRTIAHVKCFCAEQSPSLDDIGPGWLSDFDNHLRRSNPSPNSRALHLRNLRAVFNYAIDEGLTHNYPFRRFKIKTVETAKRNLSASQLRDLFSYDVDEWQEPYRDIFALSFMLMGINFADLLNLKATQLHSGRIDFNRAKTGRLYSMKVEPEAMALIDKYKGRDHLLFFMDTRADYLQFIRQTNHALKSIGTNSIKGRKPCAAARFPGLSTYWARHSWATIAASLDIPKETIAAALGHGGHSVTDIYIDFNRGKVDKANRKVLDWILYSKK